MIFVCVCCRVVCWFVCVDACVYLFVVGCMRVVFVRCVCVGCSVVN